MWKYNMETNTSWLDEGPRDTIISKQQELEGGEGGRGLPGGV